MAFVRKRRPRIATPNTEALTHGSVVDDESLVFGTTERFRRFAGGQVSSLSSLDRPRFSMFQLNTDMNDSYTEKSKTVIIPPNVRLDCGAPKPSSASRDRGIPKNMRT